MTTLGGGGRGRGAVITNLRRPGQPLDTPDYIRLMNALAAESVDQSSTMDYVVKHVLSSCSSAAAAQKVVDTIYNSSIKDRKFARVGGEVLGKLVSLNVNSSRKAVFSKLQTAYEEREKMLDDSGWDLLNFTCLLGFLYSTTLLSNGKPVRVVAEPLAICLSMLLDRTFPNIEVFAEQIVLNGNKLLQHDPDNLKKLMTRARVMLVGQTTRDSDAAFYILLCIELYAHKFKALSDDAISYYESKLTSDEMSSIVRKHISAYRNGKDQVNETP